MRFTGQFSLGTTMLPWSRVMIAAKPGCSMKRKNNVGTGKEAHRYKIMLLSEVFLEIKLKGRNQG